MIPELPDFDLDPMNRRYKEKLEVTEGFVQELLAKLIPLLENCKRIVLAVESAKNSSGFANQILHASAVELNRKLEELVAKQIENHAFRRKTYETMEMIQHGFSELQDLSPPEQGSPSFFIPTSSSTTTTRPPSSAETMTSISGNTIVEEASHHLAEPSVLQATTGGNEINEIAGDVNSNEGLFLKNQEVKEESDLVSNPVNRTTKKGPLCIPDEDTTFSDDDDEVNPNDSASSV